MHDPRFRSTSLKLTRFLSAPDDAGAREEFSRAAFALFAKRAGLGPLAGVAQFAPLESFRRLLLVLTDRDAVIDAEDALCPMNAWALRIIARAERAREDGDRNPREDFDRAAAWCSDILEWIGDEDEFARYVEPAWNTLADDVEYVLEADRDDADPYGGRMSMTEAERDEKRYA